MIITKWFQNIPIIDKSTGRYDPNSISHYGSTLPGDKTIKVLELTEKAKVLCQEEGCNPGQRESLSENDINDITELYKCGIHISTA